MSFSQMHVRPLQFDRARRTDSEQMDVAINILGIGGKTWWVEPRRSSAPMSPTQPAACFLRLTKNGEKIETRAQTTPIAFCNRRSSFSSYLAQACANWLFTRLGETIAAFSKRRSFAS